MVTGSEPKTFNAQQARINCEIRQMNAKQELMPIILAELERLSQIAVSEFHLRHAHPIWNNQVQPNIDYIKSELTNLGFEVTLVPTVSMGPTLLIKW